MATISSRRATTQEMPTEEAPEQAPSPPPTEDSFTIHEKLVAYVHAINSDPEPRSGVWMEHSYARGGGGGGGPAAGGGGPGLLGATRTLLVRRPRYSLHEPPGAVLDVDTVEPSAPHPPDPPPELVEEADMSEDEWEEKLVGSAPSVLMRRAIGKVAALLKSLRLSRLAQAGGKRDETRSHGRLLRRALAPLWLPIAGIVPAAWLYTHVPPALPPHYRALLDELTAELVRTVPALCSKLGGKLPPPAPDPYPRPGPAVMPTSGRLLLVWVGSGRERSDARWTRRFRPLLPTHYIRIHNAEAASPCAWVSGAVGAVRRALSALSLARDACSGVCVGGAGGGALLAQHVGECVGGAGGAVRRALSALSLARDACSGVCVGGAGGGALLAQHVAAGDGRVKAVLQLGPPVFTAEGPPVVVGGGGGAPTLTVLPESSCSAWFAHAGVKGAVLGVGGVDASLRVPRARRRHLRMPQHALDAALAEECARWLHETLEGAESDNSEDTTSNTTSIGMEVEDEEFAHLPPLVHDKPTPPPPPQPRNCSIEIVEGRVISRGAGGTPLALLPPRRPPLTLTPAHNNHDIMSLPVVLADETQQTGLISANNNHMSSEKVHPIVTVKGGEAPRYTKVIVAKRSAAAGGAIIIQSEVRLSPAGPR